MSKNTIPLWRYMGYCVCRPVPPKMYLFHFKFRL
jgi:hypothetical protein